MLSAILDSWLARRSARTATQPATAGLPTRFVDTALGRLRVFDSGGNDPCIVFAPDGPNVIEHYRELTRALSHRFRVVCFDMPGFGHSLPGNAYDHSLDQGANAILAVLDQLDIRAATLAFSCANGFYALRAARLAPTRITSLFLSQTPSLAAMHAWVKRVIPWPLKLPVIGQLSIWIFRRKFVDAWYRITFPEPARRGPFLQLAHHSLSSGGCFCLAGVVQGLSSAQALSLEGLEIPCVMIWGEKDRSHRFTQADSLLDLVPHASVLRFEDAGHFPELEQSERYLELLLGHMESLSGRPGTEAPTSQGVV